MYHHHSYPMKNYINIHLQFYLSLHFPRRLYPRLILKIHISLELRSAANTQHIKYEKKH